MDVSHIRYLEKFVTLPKLVPCDFQPDRSIITCGSLDQANNAGSTLLTVGPPETQVIADVAPLSYDFSIDIKDRHQLMSILMSILIRSRSF